MCSSGVSVLIRILLYFIYVVSSLQNSTRTKLEQFVVVWATLQYIPVNQQIGTLYVRNQDVSVGLTYEMYLFENVCNFIIKFGNTWMIIGAWLDNPLIKCLEE